MNLSVLSGCRLFAYVPADALPALLDAVGAYTRRYDKGQPVCRMGDTVRALGVVLSGSVTIERDDVWGNKTILDRAAPGMVFAETYACVPDTPMMVSAVAAEASEVLFIPADALLAPAAPPDAGRLALLRGLLAVSARKKPDADAQDRAHLAQIAARAAAFLSVRAGGAARQRQLRHPL